MRQPRSRRWNEYAVADPSSVHASRGLSDYLGPDDGLSIFEPLDSNGFRSAIVQLLERLEKSRDQADILFRLGSQRYDFDQAIKRLEVLFKTS
jgi:hypothetical protein